MICPELFTFTSLKPFIYFQVVFGFCQAKYENDLYDILNRRREDNVKVCNSLHNCLGQSIKQDIHKTTSANMLRGLFLKQKVH